MAVTADGFEDIQEWAAALMARLAPAQRSRLNKRVAQELRASQVNRIASQRNPDGSPYEPRRAKNLRGKKGTIRRKMFTKLRQARHLRAQGYGDSAVVAFTAASARVARVHQLGLQDKPRPNTRAVRYAVRQLLGFSRQDRALILDAYAHHLSGEGL
ncbi:phage virion morphogenesis protein [Orrella dioscoreae]|uniref:Phage tail completion protein n=1 Tax=Orrella dioscoreae TaxID=1851544 RepID=A0A1C3K396_9BURK|nr:phage virion morphogenesis protein [Orrella dioscoreae]SBT25976.1 Phage tail completion protein [Orrella dioscoreae]SOE50864.1 Phage tail completion protein [Orrella dioscoreae]